MTVRTATTVASPAFTDNARLHAATPKNGGYVLACNGRWVQHCNTYFAKALDNRHFACQRCVKGIASGRIVLDAA